MSLTEAACLARNHVKLCQDEGCRALAAALDDAVRAEFHAIAHAEMSPGYTGDVPAWSTVSAPTSP